MTATVWTYDDLDRTDDDRWADDPTLPRCDAEWTGDCDGLVTAYDDHSFACAYHRRAFDDSARRLIAALNGGGR